jgi:hypothetical protein
LAGGAGLLVEWLIFARFRRGRTAQPRLMQTPTAHPEVVRQ